MPDYIKGEMQMDGLVPVREAGYYWVKYAEHEDFQIAEWFEFHENGDYARNAYVWGWRVFFDDANVPFSDVDFCEIDPEPIIRKHQKY